ncbi:MAG: hypothetical protein P3W91_005910 [Fervidobacterium sp.]|mgnify:CR=1 FL=1|nr:hypothetical protein [Fervidobacterium sp.]
MDLTKTGRLPIIFLMAKMTQAHKKNYRRAALTKKIREEFGTLKHYAKLRGINYRQLRRHVTGERFYPHIHQQLIEDGFIQPEGGKP